MKIQQNIPSVNPDMHEQLNNTQHGRRDTEKQDTAIYVPAVGEAAFEAGAIWTEGSAALRSMASPHRGIVMHIDTFEQAARAVKNVSSPYEGISGDEAKDMTESARNGILSNTETASYAHAGLLPQRVLGLLG